MKKAKKILKKYDINPSIQRIKILKYLIELKKHPTAEMIYQNMSLEIPTISKTTIYNTMNLFIEKGIVTPLYICETEIRYDINSLEKHAHFKCTECGRLFDIDVDTVLFNRREINGHRIEDSCIYFTGKCRECRKKREN